MTERGLRTADADLEAALRDLGTALADPVASIARLEPTAGSDPAARARLRIEAAAVAARGGWRPVRAALGGRRLGRSAVLAVAAVLVIAVAVGAIELGLPGIRIVPAPATPTRSPSGPPVASAPTARPSSGPSPTVQASPTASPSPTIVHPLGSTLGLGSPVDLARLSTAVDFPVSLPPSAPMGGPVTAWVRDGRLSVVWPAGPSLPSTTQPGVGLLLTEFRGSLDTGFFEKLVDAQATVETVRIGDLAGYWIGGAPHEIVYVNSSGEPQFDSRRSVGDTLLWARGDVTYRLESGLGRAATIALAESMR